MWTSVLEMDAVVWKEGGLTIRSGGGGFGSDGFLAATRVADDHLVWLVVSQESNPFVRVAVEGMSVVATSELDQVWSFDLPRPESVSVGWAGSHWLAVTVLVVPVGPQFSAEPS